MAPCRPCTEGRGQHQKGTTGTPSPGSPSPTHSPKCVTLMGPGSPQGAPMGLEPPWGWRSHGCSPPAPACPTRCPGRFLPPAGSHSPVSTQGMGWGGKIMVHGINLGVVCIFIALASDSSLQKRFQKGLDAIKPLIILPHLTFNYCFYTCGANMPVASNQVSHTTPPAFLLPCVAPAVLSQHPVFHGPTAQRGSPLRCLAALLPAGPLLPKTAAPYKRVPRERARAGIWGRCSPSSAERLKSHLAGN